MTDPRHHRRMVHERRHRRSVLVLGAMNLCCVLLLLRGSILTASDLDSRLRDAEQQRIDVIAKIRPAVVAIFAPGGQGGGSGVLISKEGYALSNFHVVEGAGPVMHCGLPDGHLYEAVLVGLDRVGDVALIKLIPGQPGKDFPYAHMGDSDTVQAGDWSLALGNPFLLATDFQPTVTFGMVSGVHRYQYPAGTLLEYTDCIQVDASINPGNSGGPLFNMAGDLIGINGRGSFEKRGRVNSGVGYAISINQIKNFLGELRAGLDTDHATLGATFRSDSEDGAGSRLIVESILENSDAHRRGLDVDDELVSFAGRPMNSVNQFKNVLGLFPKDWRVPLVYRRNNEKHEILVRLMQLQQAQHTEQAKKPKLPGGLPRVPPSANKTLAAKFYEAKPGFANYYFNKLERDRLFAEFRKHGQIANLQGTWTISAQAALKQSTMPAQFRVQEVRNPKAAVSTVRLSLGRLKYELDPFKADAGVQGMQDPPGSGGLLAAMYQYRCLLAGAPEVFEGYCRHDGLAPFYPPAADGKSTPGRNAVRPDAEVLSTEHAGVRVRWYFGREDHRLQGFETTTNPGEDPCEVYLSDYRSLDGRELPFRIEVRFGDEQYAVFTVSGYQFDSTEHAEGGHT